MSTVEKIEKDDGTVAWLASDGKEYKSKSGAWKWNKKIESSTPVDVESKTEEKPESVDWTQMEFGDVSVSETIPSPLKKIRPRTSSKPSKKQLENEREMNVGILKVGYKTADALLTRYKRGVLNDDEAPKISHSEEDYDWISGITQDAMDHNQVNLSAAIGPNQLAIAANGYWFGSVFVKVNAEAGNSFLSGGRAVSIIERVPFIGKRMKQRRLKKIEENMLREME
tara:strand:+ start:4440 stop:5117 length:678 start_codon:yes stop_codon:yes gene_type:complete